MKHFKSIEEVKNAEIAQLCEVPEIPEHIAGQIYDFFHNAGNN